ncbi:MAG: bactofilin family protein [Tepidiformaceae bacterium]
MQIKKNAPNIQYPPPAEEYDAMPETIDPVFERPSADISTRRRELPPEGEQINRPATRAESVIDVNSTFDGRFETDQDLRVEGTISGEIVCRGRCTIERDATAKARVQARDAWVKGRVEGDIVCTGKLVLAGTAIVTGTFKSVTLVIEEGASVNGTVETVPGTPEGLPAVPGRDEPVAVKEAMNTAAEAAAAPASGGRYNGRPRDLPSFAIVSSEEPAADRR